LAKNDVQMLSFLYLVRFDIDEIEWEFVTPQVGLATLDFIELPHEYASLT
jgi:hypothetical protein